MTKTSRKIIVFMIMLMIVSLYFVSGTYARYTSSISGNAKVSTANWAVSFKQGDTAITDVSNLTFTVQENTNVVNGKIAPGTTAKATINLDLSGTEVAVDYTVTIDADALKDAFGNSAENVTVTVNGSNSATGTVKINDDGTALETEEVEIVIAITWTDANTETTNKADTDAAGQVDLTLPVTLTVQQHID